MQQLRHQLQPGTKEEEDGAIKTLPTKSRSLGKPVAGADDTAAEEGAAAGGTLAGGSLGMKINPRRQKSWRQRWTSTG